jgi:hypothetical protein
LLAPDLFLSIEQNQFQKFFSTPPALRDRFSDAFCPAQVCASRAGAKDCTVIRPHSRIHRRFDFGF